MAQAASRHVWSSTSVAALYSAIIGIMNLTGTYTVNADGTGTMTFAGIRRRHFVIGAGGNELKYIDTDPDRRQRSRRFHGQAIADNRSEAVRDQPSRFTVWRLIVSPSAGSTCPGVLAIARSMVFLGQ